MENPKVNLLTSDWETISQKKYNLIHACLVLQHIDEIYLREYLKDFFKMSSYLLIASRSYLDDDKKNILTILLEYCEIVHISTSIKEVIHARYENEVHFHALLFKKDKS